MRNNDLTATQLQGEFAQWLADNIGCNVRTLSGKGSLHAMDIVCSITSRSGMMSPQTFLLKWEKVQSVKEINKSIGVFVSSLDLL